MQLAASDSNVFLNFYRHGFLYVSASNLFNLILVRCEVAVGIQARDQTLQDFFDMHRSTTHFLCLDGYKRVMERPDLRV